MKPLAACLSLLLFACTDLAYAQQNPRKHRPGDENTSGYGVPQHQFGFGAPVAGFVHHSATASEAAYRGMAAMVQAQGQCNLLTSLARLNALEAHRKQLENEQLRAETYAAMRKDYQERRKAELAFLRGKTKAPEQAEAADAVAAIPGEILWPATLLRPEFAGYRALVERIMNDQTGGRGVSQTDRSRLCVATGLVKSKLAGVADPEADEAVRFVECLTGKTSTRAVQFVDNP
ncbi:MAG: hypothetical protein HUU20_27415 [Pirellulales bacterium]|nr:hypothetical protein [Pirellulales bacterium]